MIHIVVHLAGLSRAECDPQRRTGVRQFKSTVGSQNNFARYEEKNDRYQVFRLTAVLYAVLPFKPQQLAARRTPPRDVWGVANNVAMHHEV